ncbi:MAG: hypothetical protein ACRC33_21430, partial [Gemmataceae bacterium]
MVDAPRAEPTSLAELHAAFLRSHGKIEGYAHRRFDHLHGHERDEAVAEVVARAWSDYHRLFTQGREIEGKRGGIAVFAAKTVASGRRLVSESVNDVMSPAGRAGYKLGEPREHESVDDESPADQVALNVDFQEWLASLDERLRSVALHLAEGKTNAE